MSGNLSACSSRVKGTDLLEKQISSSLRAVPSDPAKKIGRLPRPGPGIQRRSGKYPLSRVSLGFLVLSVITFSGLRLNAQTVTNKAAAHPVSAPGKGPSNRFLFLVDTSHAMKPKADGLLESITGLIKSGIGGQARPGDTLGIWTFNQELYAGVFPLQIWTPSAQSRILSQAASFVRDQTFEKSANLGRAWPMLDRLIKDSEFITFFIISDSSQKFHGTPFDDNINKALTQWAKETQKSHMPIVTVLRAKSGKLTDFTVNPAPWGVELPPLPQELLAPPTPVAEAKPQPKPAPAPIKTAPPLYWSGKKPEAAGDAPKPAVVETNAPNPAPKPPEASAPSPFSVAPQATPGALSQPESSPSAASIQTQAATPATPPGPLPPPVPIAEQTTPQPMPSPSALLPVAQLAADHTAAAPAQPPANVPETKSGASVQPQPAPQPSAAAVQPSPAAASTTAGDSAAHSTPATTEKSSAVPATAMPPASAPLIGRIGIWVAISAVVAIVLGIMFFAQQRSRATAQISLITRSMERKETK